MGKESPKAKPAPAASSAKGSVVTAPGTQQPKAECQSWCATHKRVDGTTSTWSERCSWGTKCLACKECAAAVSKEPLRSRKLSPAEATALQFFMRRRADVSTAREETLRSHMMALFATP